MAAVDMDNDTIGGSSMPPRRLPLHPATIGAFLNESLNNNLRQLLRSDSRNRGNDAAFMRRGSGVSTALDGRPFDGSTGIHSPDSEVNHLDADMMEDEDGGFERHFTVCVDSPFDYQLPPDVEALSFDMGAKTEEEIWDGVSLEYGNSQNVLINGTKNRKQPLIDDEGEPCGKGIEWLAAAVHDLVSGGVECMPTEDLLNTIKEWVTTSKKCDEELASDLFGLVGDQFDFIQEVVKNRKSICDSLQDQQRQQQVAAKRAQQALKQSNLAAAQHAKALMSKAILKNQQPAFAQRVIVQTEEEKNLRKALNKLEKKGSRYVKSLAKNSNNDDELDFNKMREERERQLLQSMQEPVFKRAAVPSIPALRLPNVFDSLSQSKQTTAFIASAKCCLPEGFRRKDDKKWEEITVPAVSLQNDVVDWEHIKISSLDPLGQKVFEGMKKLNVIQSKVFQTAYHTNNNMLICAPTGAGKTNVAMLTMIHELQQHCDPTSLTVYPDEATLFKIVYVAPMKALATEMATNFQSRLRSLGISVREFTGDMQLSQAEIARVQVIVTTPEKWDVVTRKSKGDVQLLSLVRLIILDEIHLLQSDRGHVLEAIVARTLRYVESSQEMIRLIGLSATLPNYVDVANFLHVNLCEGLYYFDGRFRPVPLTQTFVGCKATIISQQRQDMNEACYEKVMEMLKKGQQVMIFVHSRNATKGTALQIRDEARRRNEIDLLKPNFSQLQSGVNTFKYEKNPDLREIFEFGIGIHHAGLIRNDRLKVERYFRNKVLPLLVTTSTLAWGVNLPAHGVIIKGTEMYDQLRGQFVDIGILDVMQIFGRAGRPQYDKEGHGIIITAHDKMAHYLTMLTNQVPIESCFMNNLTDNLNAEVVSGTVSTIDEAVEWLSYTYAYIRMRRNPMNYGISYAEIENDPQLINWRTEMLKISARNLDRVKMVRYNPVTGTLDPTDLGRVASHYYIKYDTIEKFNGLIGADMSDGSVMDMISVAQEFDQLKVRDEEMDELDRLKHVACKLSPGNASETTEGKVNILMQTYISNEMIKNFSLSSDTMFISQNVVRIARGLFELSLKRGWPILARRLLNISKMLERRIWDTQTPLRQFNVAGKSKPGEDRPWKKKQELGETVLKKIEEKKLTVDYLADDETKIDEINNLLRFPAISQTVKTLAQTLPSLMIEPTVKPITQTVLCVELDVTPMFFWNDKFHHGVESFWLWLEDSESNHIYHHEYFKLTKTQVMKQETQRVVFRIPLLDPDRMPSMYIVYYESDHWIGSHGEFVIPSHDIKLPIQHQQYTPLLELDPLPLDILNDQRYIELYEHKFPYFNPIQTQIFHTLFHTEENVLLGAPTGSGKTVAAEIAMFRLFNNHPGMKAVYIAPLKALVRERVQEWSIKFGGCLGKKLVELTGDTQPDIQSIISSDIIVTTPEKWDGVSRSWQVRQYVQTVGLIIFDEIHLLGEDRGPVLEVIVSRTNYISRRTRTKIRIIGLSTAIANADDLADWLCISKVGLYNFKPSIRPVPLKVFIDGYPGKAYCPRMALMNKPVFRGIQNHSPHKPALVFVSSRRQTRLTAQDLVGFLASTENPHQWLHMELEDLETVLTQVSEAALHQYLPYGIGLHHAGLIEQDRKIVETLFAEQKIHVLIATATLAWGVNLPAHMVVIKGTEYFDAKKNNYVDMPITDVLQMMGRAGRPQFDDSGVAMILCHDIKKEFYKKFLYEPFPVESHLISALPDHLNAEICAETISTKYDAVHYISYSYLFKRLPKNPTFYELEEGSPQEVEEFITQLIDDSLQELMLSKCIYIDEEDERTITSTALGRIASYYYLQHKTARLFCEKLSSPYSTVFDILRIMTSAHEWDDLPLRHNEEFENKAWARANMHCFPVNFDWKSFDKPHTKALMLLQAYFSRKAFPVSDYYTDLKSVLDQALRITSAMIDYMATFGWFTSTVSGIKLQQMLTQARWHFCHPFSTLPGFTDAMMTRPVCAQINTLIVETGGCDTLAELIHFASKYRDRLSEILSSKLRFRETLIRKFFRHLEDIPLLTINVSVCKESNRVGGSDEDPAAALESWLPFFPTSTTDDCQIHLETQSDYVLVVKLSGFHFGKRLNRRPPKKGAKKALAPHFPKPKDEGWYLVLLEVETGALIALRRISSVGLTSRVTVYLQFDTYDQAPGKLCNYSLFLMSDSYLGLDQRIDLQARIVDRNPLVRHSDIVLEPFDK